MAFLMHMTVVFGIVKDEFPFPFLIFLFIVLLYAYKYTGRRILIANIAIAGILIGGLENIWISGGIYSYNIRWTIAPVIVAFLISDKRSAIVVLILNIISAIYFYKVSTPEMWHDTQFSGQTYLMDNVFLMIVVTLLVFLFYLGQEKLANEIEQKNRTLEQRNLTLKLQKEELDLITTQLTESNQKLENYGHHTAHDIIQPARTISSFAELVLRDLNAGTITPKTKEFTEFIKQSSTSLIDMSSDLLKFAKKDYENKIRKEQLDLNAILEQVESKLLNQITNSRATVTSDNLPDIFGIKVQMASVFQNIISNAIVYRRADHDPTINIRYLEKDDGHLISFIDNGIGIPENNLDKVFNSFERLKAVNSAGTGLGLPICKQIIEFHGGRIWAESEVGKGTEIHISLPKGDSQN